MSNSQRLIKRICLFFIGLSFIPMAFPQTYPNKPIQLVLAYGAGGPTDFLARTVGEKLSERLGQPVIVEAKPGANERVATQDLLASPADGYKILLVAVPHSTNPSLFKLPYDSRRDIQPLIHLTDLPSVLVVRAGSDIKTLADLVKKAKAAPSTVSFASIGVATSTHLMVELFEYASGISMIHAPYNGAAAVVTAVLGGHVDVGSLTMTPAMLSFVKDGRLRVIAIGPSDRVAVLPDAPTFKEQGYKDVVVTTWFGLVMRAGTPAEIINKLNTEINAVLAMPSVRDALATAGMVAVGGTAEEFTSFIHQEMNKWDKVIKSHNIKAN